MIDYEYSADNDNYNESNASEEDPSFVDGINWELIPLYCEWEGIGQMMAKTDGPAMGQSGENWNITDVVGDDSDWHCTDSLNGHCIRSTLLIMTGG